MTLTVLTVLFESKLIYFPSRDGPWDWPRRSDLPVRLTDCFFTTEDGVELHGWYARPHGPADTDQGQVSDARRPVVLFFHGNAGNLTDRVDLLVELCEMGAEVLAVDYRGYGRSAGRPSEEGLYRDAAAAWGFLTQTRDVEPSRIVVWGKSLGGAVAIELAAKLAGAQRPAGLIVQSSFTSVPAMAAEHYPFLPRFLLRHRMDSLSRIGRVGCPLLVIHGEADEIVPINHGRALFDAAVQPKRFVPVPGVGHNDLVVAGARPWREAMQGFLHVVVP